MLFISEKIWYDKRESNKIEVRKIEPYKQTPQPVRRHPRADSARRLYIRAVADDDHGSHNNHSRDV